jgi:SET domain
MQTHDAFVESQAESVSPSDLFYPSQGRILGPPDVRLMAIVTLLLSDAATAGDDDSSPFASLNAVATAGTISADGKEDSAATSLNIKEESSSSSAEIVRWDTAVLTSELATLAKHWSTFFNTWPTDFTHLPMFWNETEMDAIRGTSCHAYVTRLRQNVDDLWHHVMQPVLLSQQAGFIHPTLNSSSVDETATARRLHLIYERAVGATYSRSHGASKRSSVDHLMSLFSSILGNSIPAETTTRAVEHWLCPLLDCVNGARDDDGLINVAMGKDDDDGPIELKTLRSIKSGEELFISYENKPNKDYL